MPTTRRDHESGGGAGSGRLVDHTAPDRVLVAQAVAGSADAFTALHRRYYARIYRLALLRCRSPQDAEDVASETFVKVIAHLPTFRFQGESLFPWLSRIATNLASDLGRRYSGVTLISLDGPTANSVRTLLEGLPGDAPDPHQLAERSETQMLLRAAVATLPADQAEAILLRFGGDLPLREIAIALNRSEGAVKSLLHRALVGLRKTLVSAAQESQTFDHLRQHAGAHPTHATATVATTGADANAMHGTTGHGRFDDLDI
jgi:RNA polymerase sigma-70 factor (ECF subfamily)